MAVDRVEMFKSVNSISRSSSNGVSEVHAQDMTQAARICVKRCTSAELVSNNDIRRRQVVRLIACSMSASPAGMQLWPHGVRVGSGTCVRTTGNTDKRKHPHSQDTNGQHKSLQHTAHSLQLKDRDAAMAW